LQAQKEGKIKKEGKPVFASPLCLAGRLEEKQAQLTKKGKLREEGIVEGCPI